MRHNTKYSLNQQEFKKEGQSAVLKYENQYTIHLSSVFLFITLSNVVPYSSILYFQAIFSFLLVDHYYTLSCISFMLMEM